MASLAHMTANTILSMTADSDTDNANKRVVQESMELTADKNEKDNFVVTHGDVVYLHKLIDVVPLDDEDTAVIEEDPPTPVPFCVSGSMMTHSYMTGDMNSGGMIMYMDGTFVTRPFLRWLLSFMSLTTSPPQDFEFR